MDKPVLPYAGTSGYRGSDTSEERARTQDADGTTAARQKQVLDHLKYYSNVGLTVKELCALTGMHHGQASSPLSALHKEGLIARLTERRNKCLVYVLPEYVDGRELSQYRRYLGKRHEARARLKQTIEAIEQQLVTEEAKGKPMPHMIGRISGMKLALRIIEENK